VRIHAVKETQVVEHILCELEQGRGGWVITPNVDHLARVRRDPEFRGFYAQARVVVADGMPLIWASRLQGTPLPERVAGSNLISSLSAGAGRQGRSVYLLGGDPGTAEQAAQILSERYAGLRIAGTHYPPMGFDKDPEQMQRLIEALVQADPDIVYVALGSPKQERLIGMLRERLPRAWWLGIGISFSFLSGHVKRAPVWMQKCGLEWLHRLAQEPKRLARRYLIEGIPFVMILLAGSLRQRFFARNRV
jgi:N-acetylglucosaminyldiphosphoundecaprenol N-acetyl-beta-D-mannosaminyltransferase